MIPGYKTTEFWITIIALVGGFVCVLLGKEVPIWAAVIIGGYGLSRGIVKKAESSKE